MSERSFQAKLFFVSCMFTLALAFFHTVMAWHFWWCSFGTWDYSSCLCSEFPSICICQKLWNLVFSQHSYGIWQGWL